MSTEARNTSASPTSLTRAILGAVLPAKIASWTLGSPKPSEPSADTSPCAECRKKAESPENKPTHIRNGTAGWLDSRIELRHGPLGDGLYAKGHIKKDEELLFWSGKIVREEEMKRRNLTWTLQVEDDFFQVPLVEGEPDMCDLVNHSCSPNAGIGSSGALLVAMRDIEPGEEINFDYCMTESSHIGFPPLTCLCGLPNCRKLITADDWKKPELQQRYGGYFSPYLERKIAVVRGA